MEAETIYLTNMKMYFAGSLEANRIHLKPAEALSNAYKCTVEHFSQFPSYKSVLTKFVDWYYDTKCN